MVNAWKYKGMNTHEAKFISSETNLHKYNMCAKYICASVLNLNLQNFKTFKNKRNHPKVGTFDILLNNRVGAFFRAIYE